MTFQTECQARTGRKIGRRIVGSEAEADDVVQDSFLKWHAAEQGALTTPAAWLTTVVQHRSTDRLRQRRVLRPGGLNAGGPLAGLEHRQLGRESALVGGPRFAPPHVGRQGRKFVQHARWL